MGRINTLSLLIAGLLIGGIAWVSDGAVGVVGYGKTLSAGEMTGDEMLRPEPLGPRPGKSSCRIKSPL